MHNAKNIEINSANPLENLHERPPSLTALRSFEAVARLGSISQAASELHVTHSAISQQIKLLENLLGLALFVREGAACA